MSSQLCQAFCHEEKLVRTFGQQALYDPILSQPKKAQHLLHVANQTPWVQLNDSEFSNKLCQGARFYRLNLSSTLFFLQVLFFTVSFKVEFLLKNTADQEILTSVSIYFDHLNKKLKSFSFSCETERKKNENKTIISRIANQSIFLVPYRTLPFQL